MKCYVYFNIIVSCIILVFPILGEVRTTVDPESYLVLSVIEADEEMFQLQDGSSWHINDRSIEISPGEKLRIDSLNEDGSWRFTKILPEVKASLAAASETCKIKQVHYVYWAGEVQPLVTLMDGSQWLFDEFSISRIMYWQPGDQILITKTANFHMYNLNQGTIGGIVLYAIPDNYTIQ
jgi:hypothetical protein